MIDHVYSSHPEKFEVINICWGTSDHNLVGLRRKGGNTEEKPRVMRKRVFKDFSHQAFRGELEKENWDLLKEIDDLDEAAKSFQDKLVHILDKLCPIKNIQICHNYTPWLNESIREAEVRLEIAMEVYKRSRAKG